MKKAFYCNGNLYTHYAMYTPVYYEGDTDAPKVGDEIEIQSFGTSFTTKRVTAVVRHDRTGEFGDGPTVWSVTLDDKNTYGWRQLQ